MSCKVTVSRDHDGRRLDHVIRSIWPSLPLSAIMRSLRKGEVRLDSVRAKEPNIRVMAGQELYVPWERSETKLPRARNYGDVPVVWRGQNTLIVNKPADMLVQPDVKGGDSVITRVWSMFGAGGAGFAPAAVHRLDRNTTGALVVAMSGGALRSLELLFKERAVGKRYLAVLVGEVPEKGTVSVPLLKDERNNMVTVDRRGKPASTQYQRLFSNGEFSLALITLLTGRTHQVRVHMAHIGHPVLGDRKYGNIEVNRRTRSEARRPMLHSYELSFGSDLAVDLSELAGRSFRAEPAQDMQNLLVKFGWRLPN